MMGSVAIVITSTLLLLWFLDNPYHSGVSGLKPVAMERTLRLIDQASTAAGVRSRSRATRTGSRRVPDAAAPAAAPPHRHIHWIELFSTLLLEIFAPDLLTAKQRNPWFPAQTSSDL